LYAFAELRDLENDAYTAYQDELAEWKRAAQGRKGTQEEKPTNPARIVSDVTIEKLFRVLDENPERAQMLDELGAVIKSLGAYKKNGGADRDKWLAFWTGHPAQYARVTGDIEIFVPRPVLSVCGTLQTERVDLLGGDEDGLRPRWFPHAVDQEIGGWQPKLFEPYKWNAVIRALYQNTEPRQWELTGDALDMWLAASKRWLAEAKNGENEMATAGLHKADQQCARVALVLAESLSPAVGGDLPVPAMEMAIAITDYVMGVWRSMDTPEVFAPTIADQKVWEAVRAWANFAAGKKDRRVSTRDLRRGKVGAVRKATDFDRVLEAYDDYHPGRVVTEPTGHGGSDITWVMAPEREAASGTASGIHEGRKGASGTPNRGWKGGRRGR
jgi:hypothetical protein